MKRLFLTILLATIIVVGAWTLYHRNEINSVGDAWKLARGQIGLETTLPTNALPLSRFRQASTARSISEQPYRPSAVTSNEPNLESQNLVNRQTVRIASFKISSGNSYQRFDVARAADICQQYDALAIQHDSRLNLVSSLIGQLNARGQDYVFVDRKDGGGNLAIIFNQQTLILDQQHWYTVNDPDSVMSSEPLVAWFRALRSPPELAFTFTLVNVRLDSHRPDLELAFLGELFRAVRDDGRGEDDVIIVGDFNAGDRGLNAIESKTGLSCAIIDTATNTQNTAQLDNIVYNPQATIERTGKQGVFDFMRHFNLTLVDAMNISSHLPVWAEFSIFEGHSPGRVSKPFHALPMR